MGRTRSPSHKMASPGNREGTRQRAKRMGMGVFDSAASFRQSVNPFSDSGYPAFLSVRTGSIGVAVRLQRHRYRPRLPRGGKGSWKLKAFPSPTIPMQRLTSFRPFTRTVQLRLTPVDMQPDSSR